MASQKLVLLAQDDKTVSLAVIPVSTSHAAATFRLVVQQRYRRYGGAGARADDDEVVDTMEDVVCRVPVNELCAATVDGAFEDLVSRPDHPSLRPELVAPAAREAAARVCSRYAEEGTQLGGTEFRLCVEFANDSLETDLEETGSDLERDEESWERGCLSDSGDWHDQGPTTLISDNEDEDGGAQFSARPYDGGALARESSDGTLLLLSGFEAHGDGPELADQHELTSRDVQRLVRLALRGGDAEGDEAYQRALDGGAPVSRVTRAVLLDQGLRSATATATARQQQQTTSPRGMPGRMRTGW